MLKTYRQQKIQWICSQNHFYMLLYTKRDQRVNTQSTLIHSYHCGFIHFRFVISNRPANKPKKKLISFVCLFWIRPVCDNEIIFCLSLNTKKMNVPSSYHNSWANSTILFFKCKYLLLNAIFWVLNICGLHKMLNCLPFCMVSPEMPWISRVVLCPLLFIDVFVSNSNCSKKERNKNKEQII